METTSSRALASSFSSELAVSTASCTGLLNGLHLADDWGEGHALPAGSPYTVRSIVPRQSTAGGGPNYASKLLALPV